MVDCFCDKVCPRWESVVHFFNEIYVTAILQRICRTKEHQEECEAAARWLLKNHPETFPKKSYKDIADIATRLAVLMGCADHNVSIIITPVPGCAKTPPPQMGLAIANPAELQQPQQRVEANMGSSMYAPYINDIFGYPTAFEL